MRLFEAVDSRMADNHSINNDGVIRKTDYEPNIPNPLE